ncbi:MAG: sulfatase-like hydrolase/transferase [Armatimonadota bacterium]
MTHSARPPCRATATSERFLLEGVEDDLAKRIPQQQFSGTAGEVTLTQRQWEIVRSLRDGETACVDERIGMIYDNMARRGILDDTAFIVTADHGDTQGEHGFHTAHCQTAIWDTMLHTPLVIRYPHGFGGGRRILDLVQTVDVMPTILAMAGVGDEAVWREMQGYSLTDVATGPAVREFAVAETQKPLEPFHWILNEHPNVDIRVFNRHLKAARTHEWKYIWSSDANDELYHVATDRDEQKNVVAEHRDVAEELRVKLEEFLLSMDRRDYGDCLKLTGHVTVDPDIAARLEAWGLYRRIIGASRKE